MTEVALTVSIGAHAEPDSEEPSPSWLIDAEKEQTSVPAVRVEEQDGSDDPVRAYLREIGIVPLLSWEGERRLARKMEEGSFLADLQSELRGSQNGHHPASYSPEMLQDETAAIEFVKGLAVDSRAEAVAIFQHLYSRFCALFPYLGKLFPSDSTEEGILGSVQQLGNLVVSDPERVRLVAEEMESIPPSPIAPSWSCPSSAA